MKKLTIVIVAVLAILALAGYVVSPFFYVSSLKSAFLAGDSNKLADLVDFPALRGSLKEQVATILTQQAKESSDSNQSALEALTALAGPAFLNRAVDMYCTPDAIGGFIKKNNQVQSNIHSFIKIPGPSDLDWSKLKNFSFTGPASFRIGTDHITLFARLEGLGWKVYRMEVSPDFFEESAKDDGN
jgi:predicted PurR-regulated permease PerM